ncbi:glycine-rich RNA-binding, abscisic acid-inducible protein-like [Papaver somniferum]|uniref:glycine-rich RNA-binding, abscisic acid-inducible protein-like n=1 Tax=Papaver somniferum TaxID=3469 RepID=UPI000E705CB6|nr:glycine-rich RNA-binding, abscisic acid-inducible protein-like [Papaver somniferum]
MKAAARTKNANIFENDQHPSVDTNGIFPISPPLKPFSFDTLPTLAQINERMETEMTKKKEAWKGKKKIIFKDHDDLSAEHLDSNNITMANGDLESSSSEYMNCQGLGTKDAKRYLNDMLNNLNNTKRYLNDMHRHALYGYRVQGSGGGGGGDGGTGGVGGGGGGGVGGGDSVCGGGGGGGVGGGDSGCGGSSSGSGGGGSHAC